MKSRPAVVIIVLLAVALVTWSITTTTAASLVGSHDEFVAWRTEHAKLFYGIWLAEIVVIGLPALWFTGKRMDAYAAQQDRAALAARGVGRLATAALRGDQNAVRRLIKLLDDAAPAVKYQSARALALVDDTKANEELFRKVRYWDVDHKLGLIDVLKRTMDMRTIKLLRTLTEDRNPMVARKATTALTIVSSRSGNIDDFIAKRRKQAQAKSAKAARKRAKAGGDGAAAEAAATDKLTRKASAAPGAAAAQPTDEATAERAAEPPAAAPPD